MATILAVGIATIDIINTVEAYPAEDSEVRASSQQRCRGGNATNTLVVLSQLGHQCRWAGVLVNEPDTDLVLDDLKRHNIATQDCQFLNPGKMPTSYISRNTVTGSRSIVHYRDLPEFSVNTFKRIDFSRIDWVHFEGRNVTDTLQMLQWLRQQHPHIPCSLEVEKPREGIETLFIYPDLILFSKQYAHYCGETSAADFLSKLNLPATIIATCAWGDTGAWARDGKSAIIHAPAAMPDVVQDTLGAGDTFNAGFIDAQIKQQPIETSLHSACQLAGKKCRQIGFDDLVQDETEQDYFLCGRADLPTQGFREFTCDIPQGKLALFVYCHDGQVTAYQNKCPHLGVPLNWMPDKFYSIDESHIQCTAHGALFTLDKGYCISGPCVNQYLTPLEIVWQGDTLWLNSTSRVTL